MKTLNATITFWRTNSMQQAIAQMMSELLAQQPRKAVKIPVSLKRQFFLRGFTRLCWVLKMYSFLYDLLSLKTNIKL